NFQVNLLAWVPLTRHRARLVQEPLASRPPSGENARDEPLACIVSLMGWLTGFSGRRSHKRMSSPLEARIFSLGEKASERTQSPIFSSKGRNFSEPFLSTSHSWRKPPLPDARVRPSGAKASAGTVWPALAIETVGLTGGTPARSHRRIV